MTTDNEPMTDPATRYATLQQSRPDVSNRKQPRGTGFMTGEALARISMDLSDPLYVPAIVEICRRNSALNQRQRAKITTRARVLQAARLLYLRYGYQGTTVRRLAEAIQMSTGAVVSVFPGGMDDIWRAVTGEPVPGKAPWVPLERNFKPIIFPTTERA